MKLKELFLDTQYTTSDFLRDFIKITEDNVADVAAACGYDVADVAAACGYDNETALQNDTACDYHNIIGLYTDAHTVEDLCFNGPQHFVETFGQQAYDATLRLRQEIQDRSADEIQVVLDTEVEDIKIVFIYGYPSRLIAYPLINYMEPDSEGMTQVDVQDWTVIKKYAEDSIF